MHKVSSSPKAIFEGIFFILYNPPSGKKLTPMCVKNYKRGFLSGPVATMLVKGQQLHLRADVVEGYLVQRSRSSRSSRREVEVAAGTIGVER